LVFPYNLYNNTFKPLLAECWFMGDLLSHEHSEDEACPSCGTPVKHGVTTQYIDELDAEICAVCEQPLRD
jgi:hypothetical protein